MSGIVSSKNPKGSDPSGLYVKTGDIVYYADGRIQFLDPSLWDTSLYPVGVVVFCDKTGIHVIPFFNDIGTWFTQNNNSIDHINVNRLTGTSALNGRYNTNYLIDQGFLGEAIQICLDYATLGTTEGDWYLPAAGELWIMFSFRNIINESFTTVSQATLDLATDTWSSSPSGNNAMSLRIYSDYVELYSMGRPTRCNVRPFLLLDHSGNIIRE